VTLVYLSLTALSVVVFLAYGLTCLFAYGMVADFERFGMPRLRVLTGTLEVLGALGLIAGQFIDGLVILSAGGLTVLMALGLLTRLRFRDPARASLPAFVLMLGNAYIVWYALGPARG
jgi:hypothetical protein